MLCLSVILSFFEVGDVLYVVWYAVSSRRVGAFIATFAASEMIVFLRLFVGVFVSLLMMCWFINK